MMNFKEIANLNGHEGYKEKSNIFSHTMNEENSKCLVKGYMKLLDFYNFKPIENSCVDIGCGAGYITKEFNKFNVNMKGIEYSEDALEILKEYNKDLAFEQGDMSKFHEPNTYNLIFSREVYLITRINAFTEQYNIIANIIDSLKKNGIFLLVGSDISYPNCIDYNLIIKTIRNNKNIIVSDKYYEFIFNKFNKFIFGKISYKLLELILYPLIKYKKYIIVFKKK